MAICNSCGSEGARVRTTFIGKECKDECPQCSPQSFDKFKSVRDGRLAMGWEYMPKMYRHVEDGYVATDELLADTQAQVEKQPEDEKIAYEKAVAKKRQNRKTSLSPGEIQTCIARAENMLADN